VLHSVIKHNNVSKILLMHKVGSCHPIPRNDNLNSISLGHEKRLIPDLFSSMTFFHHKRARARSSKSTG
jgi:hypothetical protein